MTALCFIDTETTGLDPDVHDVFEVAYALDDDEVMSFLLPHTLRNADPQALRLNGYHERGALIYTNDERLTPTSLVTELRNVTLVGSNPAFDAAFLRKRIGYAPWHHRMIDVTTCAMWQFGWDRPKGLADVATELRQNGHDIAEPDHTAAGDVLVTRQVYRALLSLRGDR
jgi:DNA polymerase III epsilon subunit-like protein